MGRGYTGDIRECKWAARLNATSFDNGSYELRSTIRIVRPYEGSIQDSMWYSYVGPIKARVEDPCPLGLPEVLTICHLSNEKKVLSGVPPCNIHGSLASPYVSLCLLVCLYVGVSVCMNVSLCVNVCVSLSHCVSVFSGCWFVCLSVRLSVCLPACLISLSLYLYTCFSLSFLSLSLSLSLLSLSFSVCLSVGLSLSLFLFSLSASLLSCSSLCLGLQYKHVHLSYIMYIL